MTEKIDTLKSSFKNWADTLALQLKDIKLDYEAMNTRVDRSFNELDT
jgi:hypothetical protein